jgi:hypothetical protein
VSPNANPRLRVAEQKAEISRSLAGLEDRLAPFAEQQIAIALHDAGRKLTLGANTCSQILRDGNRKPCNPGVSR